MSATKTGSEREIDHRLKILVRPLLYDVGEIIGRALQAAGLISPEAEGGMPIPPLTESGIRALTKEVCGGVVEAVRNIRLEGINPNAYLDVLDFREIMIVGLGGCEVEVAPPNFNIRFTGDQPMIKGARGIPLCTDDYDGHPVITDLGGSWKFIGQDNREIDFHLQRDPGILH